MGFRVVYIEEAISVRLYLDNVKIIKANKELTIPLSDIHTLIIDNTETNITIPLMNKCAEYNINLIFCSLEHLPQSSVIPFTGNYQHSLVLRKQMNWSDDLKKGLQKLIIQNKISNQIDLLKKLNKSQSVCETLYRFQSEVVDGDELNREGLAAKMYFRELFGPNFKRFNEDIINFGLNYGYAILRSQISKTIVAKGLEPCLGIFHRGAENPFNLSDDIIEVFRPLIDNYVYVNMRNAIIFKRDHRLELIQETVKEVYIMNKKQTLFNAISIFVDHIIDVFEKEDLSLYEEIRLL